MLPLIPPFIHEKARSNQRSGQMEVCALFADMAGFTAMTEQLMDKGIEGAEILSSLLNNYFSPILKIIVDHGGMVTTFAGDALTALFPIHTKKQTEAASKEILRVFLKKCDYPLSVKIGLGAGNVSWGIVEGQSASCYYFRGQAIDNATEAEKSCFPGEIVCHNSFDELLNKKSKSSFGPIKESFKKDIVCRFQPRTVIDASFGGEFRTVIPVFISFKQAESAKETEAFISAVLTLTQKYGGHFNLLDFGDKGATILLLFGAPIAHEDLTRRALSCIYEIVGNANIPVRAGVTHGQVFAGMVGSPLRCTYTSLGNTVNLAARLMMKAEFGQVLLDEPTAKQCRHFHLTFNSALSLKGMKKPVPSFILGKRHSQLFHTFKNKLVGRAKDIDKLNHCLGNEKDKIIIVQGGAGIGKSRLIDHAMSCRKELEMWLWFNCDKIIGGSFHPFVQWLKSKFKQQESESKKKNHDLFDELWSDFTRPITRLQKKREAERAYGFVGELLGLNTYKSDNDDLTKEQRYVQRIEAVIFCLSMTQGKWPLVIVVDDVQWLDSDSLRLLQRVLSQMPSTKLLLAARPDCDIDTLQTTGHSCAHLQLTPLKRGATVEMIKDLCGGNPTKDMVQKIIERTEGNPFFTEQLILYLLENNRLKIDKGRVFLSEGKGLPPSIASVIVSRVDKLGKRLSKLVKVASVVGQQFSLHLLSHMLGRKKIENEVTGLTQEAFWEPLSELVYIFSHALIRETVYDMQLRKTLRSLHRLVARTIEKIYPQDLPRHVFELAYHYERAGVKRRAHKYLFQAGKTAVDQFQNAEALSFFNRSLAMATTVYQKMLVQYEIASLYLNVGRWRECKALCEKLVKYAQRTNRSKMLADSLYQLGYVKKALGGIDEGVELMKRAFSHYHTLDDANGKLKTLFEMVTVNNLRGHNKRALTLIEKGEKYARERKMNDAIQTLRALRASLYSSEGKLKKARKVYESLLKKAEQSKSLRAQGRHHLSLGHVSFDLGDFKAAEKHVRQALKLFIRLGDKSGICRTLANLGGLYWSQGDFFHAEVCYHSDLRIAKEVGDKRAIGLVSGCIGCLKMDKGDYHGCIEWLFKQLKVAEELDLPEDLVFVTQQLGYTYKLLHDFKRSHEYFNRSIALCRKHNYPYLQSLTLYYQSLAWSLTKHWEKALRCNDEALKLSNQIGAKGVMFFRMELMKLRLKAACSLATIAEVRKEFEKLLKTEKEPKYVAEICYELAFLTNSKKHIKKAIQCYNELDPQQEDSEFQTKLKELREGKRVL